MRARAARLKDQNYTRLMVRLPEALHQHLAERAHGGSRSLNYEIITRLQASIELDELLKLENEKEAMPALAKLRRRLVDLRLPDTEGD